MVAELDLVVQMVLGLLHAGQHSETGVQAYAQHLCAVDQRQDAGLACRLPNHTDKLNHSKLL